MNKKSQRDAVNLLNQLQARNDGKEYCITLDPWAKGKNKWRVGEKTDAQKEIDSYSPESANKTINDFLNEYDVKSDLH